MSSSQEQGPRPSTPQPQPPSTPNDPQPPRPRPNISSMLFMTAFFFFMSGGNHAPVNSGSEIGPDGQIAPGVTEYEWVRGQRDEWRGWLNGTGNYIEPPIPEVLPMALIPPKYSHKPTEHGFYTNITGFYRGATIHPLSLSSLSSPNSSLSSFWQGSTIPPAINHTASWNETRAEAMRGSWDWASTVRWDMSLRERNISKPIGDEWKSKEDVEYTDWNWVKGSFTLTSRPPNQVSTLNDETIIYDFYGLHHLPNGTYNLYALPVGMRPDVRRLPGLWGEGKNGVQGSVGNVTRGILLREMEREVGNQENAFVLGNMKPDDISEITTCPLLISLTLPPLPPHWKAEIDAYDRELVNPTGLLASMNRPPGYWQTLPGLGGVVVADQCGWALGIEGGKGVPVGEFWRDGVTYSAFATLTQLLLLTLLIHQMESTRTPSTLSKVSLWTIIIMSIADSYVFSIHVVLGILGEGGGGGVGMFVPGFLGLCGAVIFGPRYAVLLHRIQAPEVDSRPPPPPAPPSIAQAPLPAPADNTAPINQAPTNQVNRIPIASEPRFNINVVEVVRSAFRAAPALKWLLLLTTLFLLPSILFTPRLIPYVFYTIYSFWIPQIWRNARRGNGRALEWRFVLGSAVGRVGLVLYAFAYKDNIFFIEPKTWVWGLVLWQAVQVLILYAQEKFGPAFFLPKSMAPPEMYNYHPHIPPPDAENPTPFDGETTCSICYDDVDLHPFSPSHPFSPHSPSHAHSNGHMRAASTSKTGGKGKDKKDEAREGGRDVLSGLGLGDRRGYAIAPCGHVFHTDCLAQWMGIKTICPLCKRSLPPM
ncbi:hypothetical protein L198_07845 [Cryptococcus wingfieldii CBS 7118]|uniref:RING-type E3 ubiquitin transferase n=1 Tax=Cryptococcus wingfieldii CBS 7118 TaxID=1295528 RepID=A0A1E3HV37_9TREE|nr:hypothetical protein L198_07845 [Cryptococcus wingfieldii CBS 7118]ODN80188.1 hypothetical protein L198_07845 [Cryptococcus wingfieldii CBS 7118]